VTLAVGGSQQTDAGDMKRLGNLHSLRGFFCSSTSSGEDGTTMGISGGTQYDGTVNGTMCTPDGTLLVGALDDTLSDGTLDVTTMGASEGTLSNGT
jgi:hypothetical protein